MVYIELPLQELRESFPQADVFLRSLNLPAMDPRLSLQRNLKAHGLAEFLEAGMGMDEILDSVELLCKRISDRASLPEAKIESLTVLGGHDKSGVPENLELVLRPGDTVTLVGPTGSGKSRLLEDIEALAAGDTPSGRRILIDGEPPREDMRWSAENRMVAQLSQNMNFVMDLSVRSFLTLHCECRNCDTAIVEQVIQAANALAGEKIAPDMSLTQLSGGQSRALMIADTAMLSSAPVVLIDEIENAGVDRRQALDLLAGEDKIVLISTHDPLLALLGERRLVISNGAVAQVLTTSETEKENLAILNRYDAKVSSLRTALRRGERVEMDMNAYLAE